MVSGGMSLFFRLSRPAIYVQPPSGTFANGWTESLKNETCLLKPFASSSDMKIFSGSNAHIFDKSKSVHSPVQKKHNLDLTKS